MSVLPFVRKSGDAVMARARAERRRFRRVSVGLPGRLYIPSDSREAECKIIDFSIGGASIETKVVPDVGTHVVLYVEGFGRFEGAVVRRDGEGFGECFVCPPRKLERIAERLTLFMNSSLVDETELRRHDRTPTKGITHFTRNDGSVVPCEVIDLSFSGASVRTGVRPQIGEFILIGQLAGRVARHHADGIGIEFVGLGSMRPTVEHLSGNTSAPH